MKLFFCRCWNLIFFSTVLCMTDGYAAPRITEFMAANASGLVDEDGESSDWIEIHNPDKVGVSLEGFHLTDDSMNLNKWTFPAVNLNPGAYLVVFASGKNRVNPDAPLHANFRLSASGEFLALVTPDESAIISAYSPAYPPQFDDDSFGIVPDSEGLNWSFFTTPSPGLPNNDGTLSGPTITLLEKNPVQPEVGPLTVAARLTSVNEDVASVSLYYRRMFEPETRLAMNDEGLDGDAVAGDGVWSATIPGEAFAAAAMTRWRLLASDRRGAETKEPAYRDRRDSHQYFGTVARDSGIRTALPVLHWFIQRAASAGTASGARGALYFRGEFYDNVLFTLHGQSTAGFPKKSYNIDFNRTQRFLWSEDAPRVADIDLLTNWADKSKVRHVLAYEVMRESGVAAHFAHSVRVQQNGSFFSTADLVEDADEIYLERAGLNREGALYKVYSNTLNRDAGDNARFGVEKKTRRNEDNSDLQALINGLDLRGSAWSNYFYDNIDLPRCVNMLAANSVIRNIDMHRKNWYIYRDTGRSDEWALLPWDLDLSHGRVWNRSNTYFDNRLYSDGFVVNGTSIRLVSQMFDDRAIRAMIMRRIRTLSDRFLQAPPEPGTPEIELFYERRLNEQSLLFDPPTIVPSDARLDFEKWGSWLQGGAKVAFSNPDPDVETMAEAIERWKIEYLPARRNFIYNRQIVGRGGEIPLPQAGGGPTTNYVALVPNRALAKVHVPRDDSLGTSWTGDPADEPFDTTEWLSGPTGVGYDRGNAYDSLIGLDVGSEMRRNTSIYIRIDFEVIDPTAVDQLELRLKYDDGFVAYLNGEPLVSANTPPSVAWNSSSRLAHSANPRAHIRFDVSDKKGMLRSGANVLAIHGLNDKLDSSDLLIAPELYAGTVSAPTTLEPIIDFGVIEVNPDSGNQDEEYIQLLNQNPIAVDISNWRMSGGIEHVFAAGTVIPPNGALYLSPNVSAFRARSASPKGGEGLFVQGGYQGHLSSFAETLSIVDASGTVNSTTTYASVASEVQRFLVMSELMYHPALNNLAEFIELLNISDSVTLDLQGIHFTRGVDFNFSGSAITSLAPGERVLIVRDLPAFEEVYGPGQSVAGVFANGSALSNGGEGLKLEDAGGGTILEFGYDDESPWPIEADQVGHSLVLIGAESRPDPDLAENWRASRLPGGSPGNADESQSPDDPMSDLNGNGEPDLIDYALGNDLGLVPLAPEFRWVTEAQGGGEVLVLALPTSLVAEGVAIQPEFSTDLIEWFDGAAHLELIATEPFDEARAWRLLRVNPSLRDQAQLFVRLRVFVR